jgi:hypothetical protein
MDGGAQEKAMVEQIKQIVKHTSRRKGRINTALSRFQRKEEAPVLAPKPASTTLVSQDSPQSTGTAPTIKSMNGGSSEHTQENFNNHSSPVRVTADCDRCPADRVIEL